MIFFKLKKPVKTVVKSYVKDAAGKVTQDEKGNDVVASSREVLIPDVEVPQYANLEEIKQAAGSDEKATEYFNKSVRADAVAPVRLVGNSYSTDDTDETIVAKALELARNFNPFTDRRGGTGVKALADKMKSIESLVTSGASDEEILAAIKGGKL